MKRQDLLPSPHADRPNDGMLYFEISDAVAVWGWERVLAELAEVARVRGDREVEAVMEVVAEGLVAQTGPVRRSLGAAEIQTSMSQQSVKR